MLTGTGEVDLQQLVMEATGTSDITSAIAQTQALTLSLIWIISWLKRRFHSLLPAKKTSWMN
jgi:hypothetical protein